MGFPFVFVDPPALLEQQTQLLLGRWQAPRFSRPFQTKRPPWVITALEFELSKYELCKRIPMTGRLAQKLTCLIQIPQWQVTVKNELTQAPLGKVVILRRGFSVPPRRVIWVCCCDRARFVEVAEHNLGGNKT
jgi:hypothetical protein